MPTKTHNNKEGSGSSKRKPRSDGVRTREAILMAAARAASVQGFDALSIGALAKQLGMSKSGLFAHFGSKEELELATIEQADRIFGERVMNYVRQSRPGLARQPVADEGTFVLAARARTRTRCIAMHSTAACGFYSLLTASTGLAAYWGKSSSQASNSGSVASACCRAVNTAG